MEPNLTIICRATGTSESGACSYAVITWSPELVQLILDRRELWQMVRSKSPELAQLEFRDGSVDWYGDASWDGIARDGELGLEALLDDEGMAHFEEHDWAPLSKLIDPEVEAARTEIDLMVIEERGVWFSASPKHEDGTVETPVFTYGQLRGSARP